MGIAANTVQTVGDLVVTLQHPNVNAGAATTLTGFKLADTFLDAVQEMDNSHKIALVGGGSITITNILKMGKITLNGLRTQGQSVLASTGDLILCSQQMQGGADASGGLLTVSYSGQGGLQTYTFYTLTLISVPALKLAGNDAPTYPCVFGYATYDYNFTPS